MTKSLSVALAALVFVFCANGLSPVYGQGTAAQGEISDIYWLALGPFSTTVACDGDAALFLENQIAPTRIYCEYPEDGDPVEYDPELAATTGYAVTSPVDEDTGDPIWRPFDDGTPDGLLNFDADIGGGLTEQVIFVATYVEYDGDDTTLVDFCARSDDDVQIWLDGQLLINALHCAGHGGVGACQQLRTEVEIEPGVHRIIMAVFEQGGGWGGALRLIDSATGLAIEDGDPEWFFLGHDSGGIEAPPCQDFANRELSGVGSLTACPPGLGGPITAIVTHDLPPGADAGDEVTVSECILGVQPDDITADGATITPIEATALNAQGFIKTWLHLGPYSQAGGAAPGCEVMVLDYLTDGDMTELDIEPAEGDEIDTDFGGAAASDGLAISNDTVNPDGIPTWRVWVDTDDTVNLQEVDGAANNVMSYQVVYFELDEPMDTLGYGLGSDDAIQVLVDDIEIDCLNEDRGCGGTNAVQNTGDISFAFPDGVIEEGCHRLMLKTFNGGGGHCFRFRFQDVTTGEPITEGITLSLSPECEEMELDPVGACIAIDTTRGQLAGDGVTYTVDADSGVFDFDGDVDGALTAGDVSIALLPSSEDFGPFDDPEFEHAHQVGVECAGAQVAGGDGDLTITAGGTDIWSTADQFTFAYTEQTGDFSARVLIADRIMGNNDWGKHGIMVRENCSPGSPFAFVCDQQSAAGGPNSTTFQWRLDQGIDAAWFGNAFPANLHADELRLDRVGNEFIGYLLDEFGDFAGVPGEWVEIARQTLPDAPETMQLGLAVTSHDACNLVTVTFADWDLTSGAPCQGVRGLVCNNTPEGIELTWDENPGLDNCGGTISVSLNGEVIDDVALDATSTIVSADLLVDGLNTFRVANEAGGVACAYFGGESLYINCGGERLDDDLGTGIGDGRVWEEDSGANPSPFLVSTATNVANFANGLNPAIGVADTQLVEPDFVDDPLRSVLFATERWKDGDVTYRIPLPEACYEVTLLFAEGCCSQGCEDIEDPALSAGTCRVVDLLLNGDLVEDQFAQHVVAQRELGEILPNANWGVAVAAGPYTVTGDVIEITVADLGPGGPPQNASIKGIAIERVGDAGDCGGGGDGVGPFVRGDCNGDGNVIGQVGDAIFVLNFNFLGGPVPACMAACDSNADGNVIGQVGDAIYTLNFNFLGGPAIPEPFPECATSTDESDIALGCETPIACP